MKRITHEDMQHKVDILNELTGKKYQIDSAYKEYRLEDPEDGHKAIGYRMKPKAFVDWMDILILGVTIGINNKNQSK